MRPPRRSKEGKDTGSSEHTSWSLAFQARTVHRHTTAATVSVTLLLDFLSACHVAFLCAVSRFKQVSSFVFFVSPLFS
jgi:hypothetical protein